MGYSKSKTPTAYYTTLHDSITSVCKSILPFGLKKRFLLPTESKLPKLKSENLKWQNGSFHQMLNLMGLYREEILSEAEVSAFRTHLLDKLVGSSSRAEQDHPLILRDKLLFLQELLYAKCISEGEYNFTKRPLLQKLAAQGVDIEDRDVIFVGSKDLKQNSEEEWSVINLKDEHCLANKENSNSKKKSKQAKKQVKGVATSVFSFVSYKPGKTLMEKSIFDSPYLRMNESGHSMEIRFWDGPDKVKRKPFRTLYNKEKPKGHNVGGGGPGKPARKQRGFDDRFKKWGKNESDDETAPLPLNERSDSDACSASYQFSTMSFGEEPGNNIMKNNMHSHSEISIEDKVAGDKLKKELSRIQTELRNPNPNRKLSNCKMDAISTKLPEDKADLKNYFPKYGDEVLGVVKREFKDHVGEMQNMQNIAEGKTETQWG